MVTEVLVADLEAQAQDGSLQAVVLGNGLEKTNSTICTIMPTPIV